MGCSRRRGLSSSRRTPESWQTTSPTTSPPRRATTTRRRSVRRRTSRTPGHLTRPGSSQGQSGSRASEESIRLSRQRCLSYDASMTRSASMARSQQGSIQGRKSNLFRHSMSNIPSASLPFPATRQQKQAAITALKKPLQVVTKEKSLIRYVHTAVSHPANTVAVWKFMH